MAALLITLLEVAGYALLFWHGGWTLVLGVWLVTRIEVKYE